MDTNNIITDHKNLTSPIYEDQQSSQDQSCNSTNCESCDSASLRKRKRDRVMKDKMVLDFSAYSFCAPCRRIKPLFHELEEQYPNIDFFVIETDIDNEEFNKLAQDYNIDSVPTFITLHKGNIVERLSGANPEKLKSLIANLQSL